MEHVERGIYAVQFHPEVVHTPRGMDVLRNFLFEACQAPATWTALQVIDEQVARIREQVGDEQVICALSGGVDSAVAALLVHRAVGDQLTCVFVDHGLLRENEAEQVVETFRDHLEVPLVHVQAQERFLAQLAGVTDPEEKRKRIGETFIRVFEEESRRLEGVRYLVQGTLYSDVIESGSRTAAKIKSHHNVGGLPEDMDLELVEPLRLLFKDEVRRVGDRARHAGRDGLAPAVPRPGPRDPHRRRGDVGAARDPAPRRRGPAGGGAPRRLVPQGLAELRGAAGRQVGRRHGRRPDVRVSDRHPRGDVGRRDDGRLGAPALRAAGDDLEPHHQRGARA